MLTDETVASIVGSFAAEWGLRMSRTDARAWQGRLQGAGMNEGNAQDLFRKFRDSYPLEKRKPGLAEFARFVWQATAAARASAQAASGPKKEPCFFCGDSGWVPMAVPIGPQGGYDPGARGFEPPAIWTRTAVYRAAVPCMCSAGQRAGTVTPMWADARHKATNKFPGGAGLTTYLRGCWQAHAKIEAAKAPTKSPLAEMLRRQRAGMEPLAVLTPGAEPGEGDEETGADYRGITGNRLDTAGVRKRAASGTAERTADVRSEFDVPEDEIPW